MTEDAKTKLEQLREKRKALEEEHAVHIEIKKEQEAISKMKEDMQPVSIKKILKSVGSFIAKHAPSKEQLQKFADSNNPTGKQKGSSFSQRASEMNQLNFNPAATKQFLSDGNMFNNKRRKTK